MLELNLGRFKLDGSPKACEGSTPGVVKCDDKAAAAAEEVGSVILRGVVAISEGRGGLEGLSEMGVGPTIVDDLFRRTVDPGES